MKYKRKNYKLDFIKRKVFFPSKDLMKRQATDWEKYL